MLRTDITTAYITTEGDLKIVSQEVMAALTGLLQELLLLTRGYAVGQMPTAHLA